LGGQSELFNLKLEEKMLAPHPDGHTVHRGYSWPGLEKVSQVISTDFEIGKKLRAVTDCKVRRIQSLHHSTTISYNKVSDLIYSGEL
jgi:hypothetical protein